MVVSEAKQKASDPKTAEEKRVARVKKANYRKKKKSLSTHSCIDGSIGSRKQMTTPKTDKERRRARENTANYRERKKSLES